MSLSERDRKILMLVVPFVVLAAYWFLLLSPKREDASMARDELSQQEQRLETAKAAADSAKNAEGAFESDFTEVVRLGKAIPATVDMPSLIVQLDRAAEGTGIRFTKIATGERNPAVPAAAAPAAPSTPSTDSGSTSSTPAAAGGEAAQSAPGTAVESANNAQQTENQNAAAAEQSGVSPTDTQTSTSSGSGVPVGGGATTGTSTTSSTGATPVGLETVPLELEFVGDFFNLADFFHSVKRFVRVANQNVLVGGRLITVDAVRWSSDPELFPRLKAELKATIYLSPKSEGATAGATPQGPAAGSTTPAGSAAASSGASPVPTATATP